MFYSSALRAVITELSGSVFSNKLLTALSLPYFPKRSNFLPRSNNGRGEFPFSSKWRADENTGLGISAGFEATKY